jgi:hypothetical protein
VLRDAAEREAVRVSVERRRVRLNAAIVFIVV